MFVIMKIQLRHKFGEIISFDNLLEAWKEFLIGKRNKPDVQEFTLNLFDNILQQFFKRTRPRPASRQSHLSIIREYLYEQI